LKLTRALRVKLRVSATILIRIPYGVSMVGVNVGRDRELKICVT